MAWRATLVEIKRGRGVTLVVEYRDGDNAFRREYSFNRKPDTNHIRRLVKQKLLDLKELYDYADTLNVGQTISVTNIPNPDPDPQDELDKQEYSRKISQLEGLLVAVRMGLIDANDSRISPLRQWLVDNFKTDYISLFAARPL